MASKREELARQARWDYYLIMDVMPSILSLVPLDG